MKNRRIRNDVYYSESIERVWQALTDPIEVRSWLTHGDFKIELGHRFKWKEAAEENTPLQDAVCEIQEAEAPKRLVYRIEHSSDRISIVTWSLETVGDGTRLIVEQELLPKAELKPHPKVVSIVSYLRKRTLLQLKEIA